MKKMTSRYGWQPDLPDQRDFSYAATRAAIRKLPDKIDLRATCPLVYDQGSLGSCTANAIGAAFEFGMIKQKTPSFMPSRLFIYYNERVIEHCIDSDNGAQIRDGIKSVNKQGVCPETIWKYDINAFAKKPTPKCYSEALKHQVLSYQRIVRDVSSMKGCLAAGYPFILGFTVYDAFESATVAKTGKLDMPKKNEGIKGGHAVVAVGYDDTKKRFIIRNSWGTGWGMKGYFTMPYQYLEEENLSDDFWTIRVVEVPRAVRKKKE